MPSKNIAGVLNNESNLRILEKLKGKPYYPRELAAEMKLSEPFIVRRLKAMEEHDIVEGRWETENGRRVKRYYVKDVTMQLGKDGLRVTSSGAPARSSEIDLKKEATKFLLRLPIMLIVFYGVVSQNTAIIAATCLYAIWLISMNTALYRNYPYNCTITNVILLVLEIITLVIMLAARFIRNDLLAPYSLPIGLIYTAIGFVFFIGLIYHIRFSQAEAANMTADKRAFIGNLETASMPVKVFFLPMVLRWKLSEYFNLV